MKYDQQNNEVITRSRIKGIRVLTFILSAVFLICATVAPVMAWLMQNRTVRKEAEMMLDGDMVMSTTFTAYVYDETNGKYIIPSKIEMPTYDSVFIERNENKTLIFKVPVFGAAVNDGLPFTISLDLNDMSDVTGEEFEEDFNYLDGNKTEDDPSDAIANYISNAVNIKCAVISDLQSSEQGADVIYPTAHAYFKDEDNDWEKHSFFEGTDGAKIGALTFTVDDYELAEGSEILYVYLEFAYDVDLVENMVLTRGFTIDVNDDESNTFKLDSDLKNFIFNIPTTEEDE